MRLWRHEDPSWLSAPMAQPRGSAAVLTRIPGAAALVVCQGQPMAVVQGAVHLLGVDPAAAVGMVAALDEAL